MSRSGLLAASFTARAADDYHDDLSITQRLTSCDTFSALPAPIPHRQSIRSMHANSLVTPLQFRNCIFEEAFNNLPDLAAMCAAIGSSVLAQAGRALISSTQCCHQTHILYVHHESQRGCPPWQVCSLSRSVTCCWFEREHSNLPNWQSALGEYEQQAGTDCNLSVNLQGSSAFC